MRAGFDDQRLAAGLDFPAQNHLPFNIRCGLKGGVVLDRDEAAAGA